jgi:chromate transporter
LGATQWWLLFLHFASLSLLAVGGAITTVPDMHRVVVDRQGWLSDMQFTASVALAQAAPGPNVLFVAVIGYQVGGLMGVLATMLGTLLPSTSLALSASRWGDKHRQTRALRAFTAGMAPLTIGLLLATAWVLLEPSRSAPPAAGWRITSLLLVALTLWVMLKTKRSPLWLIALGAGLGAAGWV